MGNVRNKKWNKLLTINNERFKQLKTTPAAMLVADSGKNTMLTVSRLVLNCFQPRDDSDRLFAIHIDGNKYNNQLSNLQWNEKFYPYHFNSFVAVTLYSIESGKKTRFKSRNKCAEYFNVTSSTIGKWCIQKKVMHGYRFMFEDEAKYVKTIEDLPGEKWKMFHETSKRKTKMYISSCGRSKKSYRNGKETLNKIHIINGYQSLCGSGGYGNNSRLIARLVAKHFVQNPHSYNIVDHIDCNKCNNNASNLRWVK
eukprot:277385_1